MSENRYLLCRAGRYTIGLSTESVRTIRPLDDETSAPDGQGELIDLRVLLDVRSPQAGIAVAVDTSSGRGTLIVDAVDQIVTIADIDFVALPAAFGFAASLFDGACRQLFNGRHPLRLRLQPLVSGEVENPL